MKTWVYLCSHLTKNTVSSSEQLSPGTCWVWATPESTAPALSISHTLSRWPPLASSLADSLYFGKIHMIYTTSWFVHILFYTLFHGLCVFARSCGCMHVAHPGRDYNPQYFLETLSPTEPMGSSPIHQNELTSTFRASPCSCLPSAPVAGVHCVLCFMCMLGSELRSLCL